MISGRDGLLLAHPSSLLTNINVDNTPNSLYNKNMKTITLLNITLFISLLAFKPVEASDQFVPSHRLAAQLRFEAHRAGETFEDFTPAPATREEFIKQRDQRIDTRRTNLLQAYTQELNASLQQPPAVESLSDRLKAIEALLMKEHTASPPPALPLDKQTSTTPITDDQLLLAGGGLVGASGLAGMACMGMIRRRKTNSEATPNLDSDLPL